jgi:hypothetical protein
MVSVINNTFQINNPGVVLLEDKREYKLNKILK